MEFHENQGLQLFEDNDVDSLIQTLGNIITNKFNCHEVEYCIQFLLCTSQLTGRQRIRKKHMSTSQKVFAANKRKQNYAQIEPAKKKVRTEQKALYYKNVFCHKRKENKTSDPNNQTKPHNKRSKKSSKRSE